MDDRSPAYRLGLIPHSAEVIEACRRPISRRVSERRLPQSRYVRDVDSRRKYFKALPNRATDRSLAGNLYIRSKGRDPVIFRVWEKPNR